MGVSLALKKLENALARQNAVKDGSICTLGPIIHNPQVLEDFRRRGVTCLDAAEDARQDDYVLIRAHGIPLFLEQGLRKACRHVEDATCPKVKKAQLSIAEATRAGATLLLFGEAEHPEVEGLLSYAAGNAFVFTSLATLEAPIADSSQNFVLASQTTQNRESFEQIAADLKRRLPHLTILSTICDATRERQEEALRIARDVDVMVVVGGHESGNTRRLASLARESGISTLHIESARDLDRSAFIKKSRAGLTAGASTPKSIIDEVESWLLALP